MTLGRQFTRHKPAPMLRTLVHEYWFIVDESAPYVGGPISTTPHTAAIISLNIGRPSETPFAVGAPRASLLGIQSQTRLYKPRDRTFLVMALLTIPGFARLFPYTGAASRDSMIELGAVIGDGETRHILGKIEAAWTPKRITEALDAWLLQRAAASVGALDDRFCKAWQALLANGRVDAAAASCGISTRQLERWFATHMGQSPKTLLSIDRLHASVRALQNGSLDQLNGFCDQAQQIRSWRRFIGVTPGRYQQQSRSLMAQAFADGDLSHFL